MSPENRTPSRLGPVPRGRKWLAGGAMATLSLVVLGFSSPAVAAAQNAFSPGEMNRPVLMGGDKCERQKNKHDRDECCDHHKNKHDRDKCKEKEKGKRGPTGPTGPTGPRGATGP
ncbi:hypothetical protein ACWD6R_19360, partial [Streptomyces sp. NPDC005151]